MDGSGLEQGAAKIVELAWSHAPPLPQGGRCDPEQPGQVIDEIAAPEAAWLLCEPGQPLAADGLERARRAPPLAREEIKRAAHADPRGMGEGAGVFGDEALLAGATEGDKDEVRLRRGEPGQRVAYFAIRKRPKRRTEHVHDADAVVPDLDALGRCQGGRGVAAIEGDPQPVSGAAFAERRNEVDAGDAARAAATGHAREPGYRRAIGDHQGSIGEVAAKLRVAAGTGDEIQVRGGNAKAASTADGLEAERRSLVEAAIEDFERPDRDVGRPPGGRDAPSFLDDCGRCLAGAICRGGWGKW